MVCILAVLMVVREEMPGALLEYPRMAIMQLVRVVAVAAVVLVIATLPKEAMGAEVLSQLDGG